MAEASVEFPGLPRPGQRPGISSSAGPAEPSSPLPESLRRGLTALSESVFYRDRGGSSPETSALLSSLPLQMSLYFNTAFFPCWLSCHIAMLILKLGELTGFWMLTLLLQLPLLLFLLLTPQPHALPLELAVHLVFAAFLTFQAVMGFRTIRSFSQNLSSHFLLHQFDSIPG
uniref:transmembrane protein 17-like isoform X2 n=1 Tax=Myxine glutinosa TaxID=7769 RepID=UPI00358FB690